MANVRASCASTARGHRTFLDTYSSLAMPKDKPPRRTRTNSTFKVPDPETLARKRNLARTESRQRLVRTKKKAWKRKPTEFARIYGSKERVLFVKDLPCVGCGLWHPVENHHIEGDGLSRKADYTKIVPLCLPCHREYHSTSRRAFEKKHEVKLGTEAKLTESAWQAYLNQRNVG